MTLAELIVKLKEIENIDTTNMRIIIYSEEKNINLEIAEIVESNHQIWIILK